MNKPKEETIKVGKWDVPKILFDEYVSYDQQAFDALWGEENRKTKTLTECYYLSNEFISKQLVLKKVIIRQLGIEYKPFDHGSDYDKFNLALNIATELVERQPK
jgi:hypothetical protein